MREHPMFRTFSGISFIVVAVLALLQAIPVIGFILLLFSGGMLLGYLINIMLVSILIEAAFGRISRGFLAIPLVAFGGYYLAYAYQTFDIRRETAALQASNPASNVFEFDPNVHALISPNAEALASFYKIPVAYIPEPQISPEKYLSYRLIERDQCNLPRDSQNRIIVGRILFEKVWLESVCLLRFPDLPSDGAIQVVKHGFDEVWKQDWRITEQVTELRLGNSVIGSFKTASVWRLPLFPLLRTGCVPGSVWRCLADFDLKQMFIDAIPAKVDRTQFDTPETIMLGIARRTASDFANFRGYRQNDAALARVAQEPQRVENETFVILKSILDGETPQQPLGIISYTITQNPARLAPFSEAMATRLAEFNKLRSSTRRRLLPINPSFWRTALRRCRLKPSARYRTRFSMSFEMTPRRIRIPRSIFVRPPRGPGPSPSTKSNSRPAGSTGRRANILSSRYAELARRARKWFRK
jgi:hypothetical protein